MKLCSKSKAVKQQIALVFIFVTQTYPKPCSYFGLNPSFNVTVRLKTSFPGRESLSMQK